MLLVDLPGTAPGCRQFFLRRLTPLKTVFIITLINIFPLPFLYIYSLANFTFCLLIKRLGLYQAVLSTSQVPIIKSCPEFLV
jgi:hypothetical protein